MIDYFVKCTVFQCLCSRSVGNGYLSMAVFILIYRSHSYRWAAVVSPIELTILSVEPRDSYVQDQVRHCVWPSEGLFAYLYVHYAASHVHVKVYIYTYIYIYIYMATCLPSRKLFKLDEPDMQDSAGEAGTSS